MHRFRNACDWRVQDFSLGLRVILDGNGKCKVAGVEEESCCFGVIHEGDVIQSVDDIEIDTVEDLRDTCRGPPGSMLKLAYRRNGTTTTSELCFLRTENEETGEYKLIASDPAFDSDPASKALPVSPVTGQLDQNNVFREVEQAAMTRHFDLRSGHLTHGSRNNTPVKDVDNQDKLRHSKDFRGSFSLERHCDHLEVCSPPRCSLHFEAV